MLSKSSPKSKNKKFAVLPLRDIVVFPHMIVPLFVGREKSVKALEHVMQDDKQILLMTQKSPSDDNPGGDDLYEVGTIGNILQLLKLPDGTVKVLVEGGKRHVVKKYIEEGDYVEAEAIPLEEDETVNEETEALSRAVISQFEQYVKLNKKIPPEVLVSINQIDDILKMADTVASHLSLKIDEKQDLLELKTIPERLEKIYGYMEGEIGLLQVEKRVRNRVKRQMEKTQREYYLNEQMKAIQKELGDGDEGLDELGELEKKISETKLSKEAKEKATTELKKLRQMSPMSSKKRSKFWTKIIMAWKKLKNVFWNILRCSNVLIR